MVLARLSAVTFGSVICATTCKTATTTATAGRQGCSREAAGASLLARLQPRLLDLDMLKLRSDLPFFVVHHQERVFKARKLCQESLFVRFKVFHGL
jgi:hypothetical protein